MRIRGLAIGLAALAAWPAAAHDSPGDVIHALSHRMETEGPTARLLVARAFEYQAVANWEAAAADFNSALALQPRYGAAVTGLAGALLHQGDLDGAEAAARRGIALYDDPAKQAPAQALLARALAAGERWTEALEAWRQALKAQNPEVDWYLGEAEALARLNRFEEQSEALKVAKTRNPSVVLHRVWVRSLVDAGHYEAARLEIDRGIARSRWRSSWLLLRARMHALRGDREGQRADAAGALAELQGRLNTDRPDPWLLAESGIALAMLGETDGALARMEQARDLGMPDAGLRELHQLIAAGSTSP